MKREKQNIEEKVYLNPGEAIEYWGLSKNKFRAFIKGTSLSFVAHYKNRSLVIREEFEKYIKENPEEYRRLKCRKEETRNIEF